MMKGGEALRRSPSSLLSGRSPIFPSGHITYTMWHVTICCMDRPSEQVAICIVNICKADYHYFYQLKSLQKMFYFFAPLWIDICTCWHTRPFVLQTTALGSYKWVEHLKKEQEILYTNKPATESPGGLRVPVKKLDHIERGGRGGDRRGCRGDKWWWKMERLTHSMVNRWCIIGIYT